MKLLVATTNKGKLAELRKLLPDHIDLITLRDVGLQSPAEDGETFFDNALIKARSALQAGYPVLAEDSGLEVDALDGAPGVLSARYAGPGATDEMNNSLLLEQLSTLPKEERRARYRSVVVLMLPNGREFVGEGTLEGVIAEVPRGTGGFGYDPIFEIDDAGAPELRGLTVAQLSKGEKNTISHRARACRALLRKLREEQPTDPVIASLLDTSVRG